MVGIFACKGTRDWVRAAPQGLRDETNSDVAVHEGPMGVYEQHKIRAGPFLVFIVYMGVAVRRGVNSHLIM